MFHDIAHPRSLLVRSAGRNFTQVAAIEHFTLARKKSAKFFHPPFFPSALLQVGCIPRPFEVMFANLLPFRRRQTPRTNTAFVRDVAVKRPPIRRNRRSEVLLVVGWGLILCKCWGTFWVVERYQMPFNPWWIVLPTFVAAALCTWVYWRRN